MIPGNVRIPTWGEIRQVASSRGSSSRQPWAWNQLIGMWLPVAGSQGSRLFNHAGNHYDGILTNMVTSTDWQAGKIGTKLAYNGGTNYVNFGSSTLGDFTLDAVSTDRWTASVWARCNVSGPSGTMLARAGGADTQQRTFQLFTQNDDINVFIKGTQNLAVVANVNDGLWHNYTITWDGVTLKFYFDGTFDQNLNIGVSAAVSNNIAYGARDDGGGFVLTNSQLSSLFGWTRALSAKEIRDLYDDRTGMYSLANAVGGVKTPIVVGNRRRRFFMGAA